MLKVPHMPAGVQPLIKIRQRWHTLKCRTATPSTSAWRLSCDQRAATRELLFQPATSDTCKHAFLEYHLPQQGPIEYGSFTMGSYYIPGS